MISFGQLFPGIFYVPYINLPVFLLQGYSEPGL